MAAAIAGGKLLYITGTANRNYDITNEGQKQTASDMLETVIKMNEDLCKQMDIVETLRLKINVDAKQYEEQIAKKDKEIRKLKKDKNEAIDNLEEDRKMQKEELQQHVKEINRLSSLLRENEIRADSLHEELEKIRKQKSENPENDKILIQRLENEIGSLKEHLTAMQTELNQANDERDSINQKMKDFLKIGKQMIQHKNDLEKTVKSLRGKVKDLKEIVERKDKQIDNLIEENKRREEINEKKDEEMKMFIADQMGRLESCIIRIDNKLDKQNQQLDQIKPSSSAQSLRRSLPNIVPEMDFSKAQAPLKVPLDFKKNAFAFKGNKVPNPLNKNLKRF